MTESLRIVTDRATARVLRTAADVEEHIRAICFKTGPPALIGAELEWTVHHAGEPSRPLKASTLHDALGQYTPGTLRPSGNLRPNGEAALLPGGGRITAEPGGQLEISSAPAISLLALHRAVDADLDQLTALLDSAGLTLGTDALDGHREPSRLLETPRYAAMESAYDAHGPHGRTMMCSTAGLQVCVHAGAPGRVATRWAAVHALGPVLIAAFANSPGRPAPGAITPGPSAAGTGLNGRGQADARGHAGWASARMGAWWDMDPRLTHPVPVDDDPAAAWARYALDAPLTCVRRDDGPWDAPPGVTFRDWLAGALSGPPTVDDLEYHLSTLFPPVRPRGYLEIRYLDTQPGAEWFVPVAVLAALLSDDATTQAALDLASPAAGHWVPAMRYGLADPLLRRTAEAVLDLACRRLGLPPDLCAFVRETVARRLTGATESAGSSNTHGAANSHGTASSQGAADNR